MRHLRPTAVALAALIALGTAGCGDEDESTPTACGEGAQAYIVALDGAPGAVRLEGDVPISECLTENQGSGQLQTVGAAMVDAAVRLNAEARAQPGGAANLELGYLVGAAERGAEDTTGIHAELIRRLEAAALYRRRGGEPNATFLRAYREGVEAGREDG